MNPLVAILGSLLLLAVVTFCVFGFLATLEPTDKTAQLVVFRIGYSVIGLVCVVGVGFLVMNVARR